MPRIAASPLLQACLLGVTQIVGFGSTLYLLTVLAAPIGNAMGWPLAWVSGGMSAGIVTSALVAPHIGRLIAREGGRRVLMTGSLLLAAGLATIGLAWHYAIYLIGWSLVGLGMACSLYDAVFSTLGRAHGHKARRLISTVALWGGFASTVFWTLSGVLVEAAGWRVTCLVYAAAQIAICLPLFFFAAPAGLAEAAPADPDRKARPHPVARTVHTLEPARTLSAILFIAEVLVASIIAVHLVNLLARMDVGLTAAVVLGAFIGPAQVAGRAVEMTLGQRLHPAMTVILAIGAIITGLGLLTIDAPVVRMLAVIVYGAGIGVLSIARGTLPLALFGPVRQPVVTGQIARPIMLVQAVSPVAGAFAITRLPPETVLWLLAAIAGIALAASLLLRRICLAQPDPAALPDSLST